MGLEEPRPVVDQDQHIELAVHAGLKAMRDVSGITFSELGSAAATILGSIISIVVEHSHPEDLEYNKTRIRVMLMDLGTRVDPPKGMN